MQCNKVILKVFVCRHYMEAGTSSFSKMQQSLSSLRGQKKKTNSISFGINARAPLYFWGAIRKIQ